MLQIIVLGAMLPFAALGDWFGFIKQQGPREQELTKASHGAAMLALVVVAAWMVGPAAFFRFMLSAPREFPDNWMHWLSALVVVAAAVWGLLWFSTGVRRSLAWAGFHDARLTTRAVVKVALGVGLWLLFWRPSPSWSRDTVELLISWRGGLFTGTMIEALIIWLVVTGLVKFLLVRWRRSVSAKGGVIEDIETQDFDWDA